MSVPVVRAINSLQKSLGRMSEEQTKALVNTMAPLSQLPKIAETQARESIEAAYDVVRSQVLIAIAQQKGQLGAKESQINEELQEIEHLRKAAEKQTEVLKNNMMRQLEEINGNTAKLVEQMDRPVMDLGRRVFTDAVFLPYTEQVVPHWSLQIGAGIGSQEVRRLTFEHGYNKIRTQVENYISEVEELQTTTRKLSTNSDVPSDLSVPICVVTYEDEGHIKEEMYLAPSVGSDGETVNSPMLWLKKIIQNKFSIHSKSIMNRMIETATLSINDNTPSEPSIHIFDVKHEDKGHVKDNSHSASSIEPDGKLVDYPPSWLIEMVWNKLSVSLKKIINLIR